MPGNEGQPKPDPFVSRVVSDPNNPPDALLLSGYIGQPSEPDHTRFYFDPQLTDYVEIPNPPTFRQKAAREGR